MTNKNVGILNNRPIQQISPNLFLWEGKKYPLQAITRMLPYDEKSVFSPHTIRG